MLLTLISLYQVKFFNNAINFILLHACFYYYYLPFTEVYKEQRSESHYNIKSSRRIGDSDSKLFYTKCYIPLSFIYLIISLTEFSPTSIRAYTVHSHCDPLFVH